MKIEDLCVAVDELLKKQKIDDILPGCFTKRNMEGFKKTLNQKKGQRRGALLLVATTLDVLGWIIPFGNYAPSVGHGM